MDSLFVDVVLPYYDWEELFYFAKQNYQSQNKKIDTANHTHSYLDFVVKNTSLYLENNKIIKPQMIDAISELNTNSIIIRSEVENSDFFLFPGTTLNIKLEFYVGKKILIPQQSCFFSKDGSLYTFVVKNGIVFKVDISAKYESNGYWIVENGLSEGDVIIYSGFQKIKNGDAVKIVKKNQTEFR
jgi:multidrug efflux pump subunit AcrA (membrane-fusion protein)